jgi:hypothetical protein
MVSALQNANRLTLLLPSRDHLPLRLNVGQYPGEKRQQFLGRVETCGLPRDHMLDAAREALPRGLRLLPKLHDEGSHGGEGPLHLRSD